MIYVLGKDSTLGRIVYDYLHRKGCSVVGTTKEDFNAADIESVRQWMNMNVRQYDYIINCIDTKGENMYIINAILPHYIDRMCCHNKVRFIHSSTDMVFTGYGEKHNPDECEPYGLSKGIAEFINGMVIRAGLIDCRTTLPAYTNHYSNGITCLEWAKQVYKIIESGKIRRGVVSIQSPKTISNFELLTAINAVFDQRKTIKPIEDSETIDKSLIGDIIVKPIIEQLVDLKLYSMNWL